MKIYSETLGVANGQLSYPILILDIVLFTRPMPLSTKGYLTIRPVALEGERFNCFSITQLVGQKRQ